MGKSSSHALANHSSQRVMQSIPKRINIIWLGDVIHKTHITRINQWKKMNPEHRVCIWVERKFVNDVRHQFISHAHEIKELESVPISSVLKTWINKLISPREDNLAPNYAAASDLYRFYILMNNKGGWYFDTDIRPFFIGKRKTLKDYGFIIHKSGDQLTPYVIAAIPGCLLITRACYYFACLAIESNEVVLSRMRDRNAIYRQMSTESTNGTRG